MPVYKEIRDLIGKYSFVENIEFKNAKVFIYYKQDGKTRHKRLPFRADKNQVIKAIEAIKKNINYEEDRDMRIKRGDYDTSEHKPSNFVFSGD